MEKIKSLFWAIIVVFLMFTGCGKSGSNDPAPVVTPPAPGKAILLAPAKDLACLSGQNIIGNQGKVNFSWQAGADASSYELHVRNLVTSQEATLTISSNATETSLPINAPYSWYVVSKSTASIATTQSDTWKFYFSGPTPGNSPPFPAEPVKPLLNSSILAVNGKTTLQWSTSDPDGDALTYDIYMGTTTSPQLIKSGATSGTFEVNVTSGTTYYWKVICMDGKGNSSDAGLFKFTVN